MSSIDARSSIVPSHAIQRPIAIVGLAALAALVLVLVPGLGLLSYPFRLLITIVHELSHGLVALLTGGAFLRFVVFGNGEGVAYTAGGWRLLVIPAGYLGSALFGASLIRLGGSVRWSRAAMAVLGAAVLLLSLRYGLPSIATLQWSSGVITVVAGVAIGFGFVWVARKATTAWVLFLTNLVAMEAGLTAFSDLFALIQLSSGWAGAAATDARAMSELTLVPALVWAVLWAVVALALIGAALW